MQKRDAAAFIAGLNQTEGSQAAAPTNLHVISGEVGSTSENGKTTIAIDGLVFSEADDQYVEMDTLGGLEEGDIATVILTGETGHVMTPLAVGAIGSIDRVRDTAVDAMDLAQDAKDIAEATGQHFWYDDNGAHVSTEEDESEGAQNSLWNSLGMLFRKYANNVLAIVTGNNPGVDIYDGNGNENSNIVAAFHGNLIELGRNSYDSIIKFCRGMASISYNHEIIYEDDEPVGEISELHIATDKTLSMESDFVSVDDETYPRNTIMMTTDGVADSGGTMRPIADISLMAQSDPENNSALASIGVRGGADVSGIENEPQVNLSADVLYMSDTQGTVDEYLYVSRVVETLKGKNIISSATTANVSVPNGSDRSLTSITISDPGIWLLIGHVYFVSNTTGRRVAGITTSSNGSLSPTAGNSVISTTPVSGGNTAMTVMDVVTVGWSSSSLTRYITVYQNSGSALNAQGSIKAIRVSMPE